MFSVYKQVVTRDVIMALLMIVPLFANASTIVSMQTSLGDIEIQLFDETAPQTVANFLDYVNSGSYTDSFIHRSVPGFVVQGGGYTWDTVGNSGYSVIPANAPVVNEFGASNLRGTIAMAKLPGDPNSATKEWFFNLADNSANLDSQNGGFTVFGQVIGNGMQVVDQIGGLATVNAGGPFTNLPLISSSGGYNAENLVLVKGVQVVPLPSAVWFFATGLLAATVKRRKA